MKVLLADDSDMMRDAMRRILESERQIELVGEAGSFGQAMQANARCLNRIETGFSARLRKDKQCQAGEVSVEIFRIDPAGDNKDKSRGDRPRELPVGKARVGHNQACETECQLRCG
jgi:hypothetical protein